MDAKYNKISIFDDICKMLDLPSLVTGIYVYIYMYIYIYIYVHRVLWYNWLLMRPRNLCDLAQKKQFQMYVDFIYVWLYMEVLLSDHRYKLCEL